MGLFGKLGATYGSTSVAETGAYLCSFKGVEKVQKPSKFHGGAEMDCLEWRFVTIEDTDDNGDAYEFVTTTQMRYGGKLAKITQLVNGMMGRELTEEEFNAVTDQMLKSASYIVSVEKTNKGNGDFDKIIAVTRKREPKQQAQKPSSQPVSKPATIPASLDEIGDPFAEE